jgi:6-pyruvoyltetrahydropterin/6-carboxytetrahydropterin synthase
MKFIIDKSFSFCYGHRVHNQRLDTKFTESGDACLACRHLHGHEGLVKVFLEEDTDSTNVKDTGMVTDFKHLGWFKNFLDDTLDHKFIMDLEDPILYSELTHYSHSFNTKNDYENSSLELVGIQTTKDGVIKGVRKDKLIKHDDGFYTLDLNYLINDGTPHENANFEKYEGIILVDFVPTSENLTAWLLSVVQKKMKDLSGVKVKAIEYWETPKSHCRVEA